MKSSVITLITVLFAAQAHATTFSISGEQAEAVINGLGQAGISGQSQPDRGTVFTTGGLLCTGMSNAATSSYGCTNDLGVSVLEGQAARLVLELALENGSGSGSVFTRGSARVDHLVCKITGFNGQTDDCTVSAR